MYPQRIFRSHEDEDEQILYRPNLVESESYFRIPIAQLIIFGLTCALTVLFLNSFLEGWFNSYSASPAALKENFVFNRIFLNSKIEFSPGHFFIGSIISAVFDSAALVTHSIAAIQLIGLLLPLAIVLFRRAGLVPLSFALLWLIYEESTLRSVALGIEAGWLAPVLSCFLAANLLGSLRLSTVVVLISSFLSPALAPLLILTQIIRVGFSLGFGRDVVLAGVRFELFAFSSAILLWIGAAKFLGISPFQGGEDFIIALSIMVALFLPLVVWDSLKIRKRSSTLGVNVKGTITLLVVGAILQSLAPKSLEEAGAGVYNLYDREVWSFVASEVEPAALLGGHPETIDQFQFFGKRKAVIDSSYANLFFVEELQIVKNRERQLLKAHFATDAPSFIKEADALNISHFIFDVKYFSDALLKEFSNEPLKRLLFARMPERLNQDRYPFLIFRNNEHVVISVTEFKEFLKRGGRLPWPKA